MPRIAGVDIPNDKQILFSLTYIYGIGRHTAAEILKAVEIGQTVRAKDLAEDDLSRLSSYIDQHYAVEGQLRRQDAQNVNRLREIRCYRGLRHRMGLPVRGQRTRTNARTRKGPRRTVAVKRGVKELH